MKMKLAISLLILLLGSISTNANAFFFLFLPGSVTGKIVDAFTGADGENCVGPNVKVGDTVRLPAGGTATVKSLSGTSSRCTDPQSPIRALLQVSTFTSQSGIDLPAGWESVPVADALRARGRLFQAENRAGNIRLSLSAQKRQGDMLALANSARAGQANLLVEPQQSEIEQIQVNGMRAWRFEVTGTYKGSPSGPKTTYLMTILEGADEVVAVNAWAPADNFDKQKEAMKQLAGNITGINAPTSPVVASPPTAPVVPTRAPASVATTPSNVPVSSAPPAAPVVATPLPNTAPTQSESAANKLRDLNKLYKEGVINEKDFETKKQEILKSM